MLTRCPRCGTTFRITPEHLKMRQGRVRCGACQGVFNALESLEEEAAAAPATIPAPEPFRAPPPEPAPAPPEPAAATEPEPEPAPPESESVPTPPPPAEPPPEPEPEPEPESEPEPEPEPEAPPTVILAPVPEPAVAERELPAAAAPEPAEVAPAAASAAGETEAPPDALAEPAAFLFEEEAPPPRRWPWVLGSLLALLALAGQAAVQYRVQLAVALPEAKPALRAACDALGLDLPLPSRIDLVGIETSDLHPDPAGEGRFQLAASLRNRAPFAQSWPHLELTLTDANDRALVRRAVAPAEYLPAEVRAAEGFAARGDQAIRLAVEATGVPAVGYRLYVFYP